MKQNVFYEAVYAAVRAVPQGKVVSYGTVAALAGNPRAARAVGRALHVNPDPVYTPCYRVVHKDGRVSKAFAFGGENMQRQMLLRDGVAFDENGLVKKEFFWYGA